MAQLAMTASVVSHWVTAGGWSLAGSNAARANTFGSLGPQPTVETVASHRPLAASKSPSPSSVSPASNSPLSLASR